MYCKNCGRKLKEGTRFCDRCGQSVRQSQSTGMEARQREIKELQEERLNRKRRLAEQEEKQKRITHKRKHNNNVLIFFMAVLLLMVLSALVTFFVYDRSTPTGDGAVALNTPTGSPDADATPVPTAIPTALPSTGKPENSSSLGKETVSADNSAYKKVFITEEIEFSYPSVFTKTSTDEDYAVLGLKDSGGDAEIIVYECEYPGGTASSLMKAYASKMGGSIEYSRAGDGWYVITIVKNNNIYHRKYVFTQDDSVVYYDFKYSTLSTYADEYEEYIKYMDEQLNL